MSNLERLHYAGRRVFGAVKRPIFEALFALSGERLQSDAEYLDFGWYGGTFEAPAQEVQRRLSPGFEAIERRPGWTDLDIWAADYRHVDILRPYREIAVLAPARLVRPGKPAVEGSYVLQMVVTTEEARWTGLEIHGFPKIVADVDVSYGPRSVLCSCRHRGVHVLTLRVEMRPTAPFEDRVALLNVRPDGRVLETDLDRSGALARGREPGGVSLELGDHAIADQLREIGVRPESGRVIYVPHCRGVLRKAHDLGPLAVPGRAEAQPERPGEAAAGRAAPSPLTT